MNIRSKEKTEIGYILLELSLNNINLNINRRYGIAKINIKKNISELKKDDNEDINNRLMIGNNPYIIEITSLDNKKNYRIGYTFFENDMIEVDEYYRKESVIYFSNYDNLINYFMNVYRNEFQIKIGDQKIQLYNPFNKRVKVYEEYIKEKEDEGKLNMILDYNEKGFLERIYYIKVDNLDEDETQFDYDDSEKIDIVYDKSKKYSIYNLYGELYGEFSKKKYINSWTF